MEIDGLNPTLKNPIHPDKSNQKGHEETNRKLVKEKNLQVLLNSTNNVFYKFLSKQIVHRSESPHSQVTHSEPILKNKNENVQKSTNRCNASIVRSHCVNAYSKQSCNDVKLKSKQCVNEEQSCSNQIVIRNEFGCTVEDNNDNDSKVSCIYSKNSGKNNSLSTFMSSIEPEIDRKQGSGDYSSSLDYYGHWLEIKDENMEEMKDKFLPECEVDEAGEMGICSTEEMQCKSRDLDEGWSHFIPMEKYENKSLIRCKDKHTEYSVQYSHSQCSSSCDEQQVACKGKTSCLSIFGHDESKSTSQENGVVSSLVTNTGCLGNKQINSSACNSSGLVGSWLKIDDGSNRSIEFVFIPDKSRSVEDTVNSVNKAVQVKNTETVSETLFSPTVNENLYSAMSLSKTNKQKNSHLLDKCSSETVKEQEHSNQAMTSSLGTCKHPWSVNNSSKKSSLSDFDFFSTNADVEKDEGRIHINENFDTELGTTSDTKEHFIQFIGTNEKTSLYLLKEKKCVTNKLVNMSYSGEYTTESFQCSNCHLLFDSSSALHNHRVLLKHVELYKCNRCKKIFKQAYRLKKHLQRNNCIQFKCPVCEVKFSNRDIFRDHITSHFVDCHLCGKTCNSEKALKLHYNKSHNVKTYLCPECNESFVSSKSRSHHLILRHSDKIPKFTCSICKKSYVMKHRLIYHMKRHLGEKPFMCPDCGKSFIYKKQLKRHSVMHITEKLWKCLVCRKGFKAKFQLTRHMFTHTGEKRHECAECGRCFLRFSNLRVHMLLHAGVKKFHCEICKKSFFSRPSLMMHMAKHLSGDTVIKHAIKCVICCLDMRHLKTSLKIHLKQHTIRAKVICKGKFDCHICGKRYDTKHSLGYHLNVHRNVNYLKCTTCKAVFRHFVKLLCHSYLHLRTKKYRCNICGNEFSLLKGLIGHMEVHSGKNPYKCAICKQRFPEHLALVRHLKLHVEEKQLHRTVG